MRKMKKIQSLALALLMLCSLLLCACTPQTDTPTGDTTKAKYKVTVIGADGKPCTSGVIVKFMKGGTQVAMQAVDATGVASKELDKADYTVELQFTDTEASYHYNETELKLSATKTELEVTLYYATSGEGDTLVVNGEEFKAYTVDAGNTYVELSAGKRTYFIFVPTQAGKYQFSVDGTVNSIGYYGSTHFVMENNIGDVTGENVFTTSVTQDNIGTGANKSTGLVIGIDAAEGVQNCVLKIARLGDPDVDITDLPWEDYQTTAKLTKYTLPESAALKEFDLTKGTSEYTLVKDADGYYHLNTADGPLVLARIGQKAQVAYAAPLAEMAINQRIGKYFYNDEGEFEKKESYSDCLFDYVGEYDFAEEEFTGGYIDEASGTYPLTDDLMYIMQQYGDFVGWWDASDNRYLFKDENGDRVPNINADIAWLFMCCYLD